MAGSPLAMGSLTSSSTSSLTSSFTSSSTLSSTLTSISASDSSTTQGSSSSVLSSNTGTQSSTTATSSSTTTPSAGLGSGIVAGIGIGAALAGIFIGFIIAFVLFGRRSKRQPDHNDRYASGPAKLDAGEGREPIYEKPVVRTTALNPAPMTRQPPAVMTVDAMLPQPIETNMLIDQLAAFKVFINNHVTNFYTSEEMTTRDLARSLDHSILTSFTSVAAITETGQLLELLASSSTRFVTLRYIIAFSILSRLQVPGIGLASLLPPGTAATLRIMNPASFEGPRKDYDHLLSLYRRISSHLTAGFYKREAFTKVDDRDAGIHDTLQMLDTIIAPFAVDQTDQARTIHLFHMTKSAASFGGVMIGQGAMYMLDWNMGDTLPVFPRFFQVTEDNGLPLSAPRELGKLGEVASGILL